jgi:murein DD-endopeptidase MepM/ murein hydrolase activator NlpD
MQNAAERIRRNYMSYKIQSGDTLSALAQRYNTTVSKLAELNKIKNPDLIHAGASLKIPGAQDSFDPNPVPTNSGQPATGSSGAKGNTGLADAGRAAAMSIGGYNSQGLCATGVSRAIQNAYGIKVHGNGNQIDDNLPRSHFKQVNMSLEEALKTPGLILTWESTSSSAGSIYGHTAITSGDGRSSYSDFIERNTLAAEGGRRGLKIFTYVG